jgi:hypothetical protein
VAALGYVFATGHWPDAALPVFVGLGVSLAALFSAGTAFVLPQAELNTEVAPTSCEC